MKKIYLSLLLITSVLYISADPVTKQEAQLIAEKFFAYNTNKNISEIHLKDIIEHTYNNEASFYLFSFDKGGFVIVSADDLAYPVLAYSSTSKVTAKIDNPSTRYFLERYKKQIDYIKKQKVASPEIQKQWDDYKKGIFPDVTKAVAPLISTSWDQMPYYNMYCPTNTPTGCVATAMSQIMNYHEWPATGNGWHRYIPSENPSYGEQFADFGSTTYDWGNMPSYLSAGSATSQKTAIATLMRHAGVAVDMSYDPDGSGAVSQDVLYALTSYFKYDPTSIQLYTFNAANTSAWLTLAKNELNNSRPIYYDGGSDADGGHAWVCDGYDASDRLHINWGWSNVYDGYFAPNAMNPGSYDFNDYNSMIIGIKPGVANQDMLWTKQASSFNASSRGIQFISAVDSRTAWAVAYDGSGGNANVKDFTKTTDGGVNWSAGTINTSNTTGYGAAMISAIDANTAWVALFGPSGGGKIVKTNDGGTSWTYQSSAAFSAPNGFPNVVHFWDANNGFCMGDPNGGYFEIYTTTNGGDTWTRVPQANIPANTTSEYGTVGYYAVVGDIVWFATNKGRIYKSVNKGLNWVAYQTPITNASFELSFKDANTGIIQRRGDGDNKIQYITTNGGETWNTLTPTGNFYTAGFTFVPGSGKLISVGVDASTPLMGLSYSTDNGSTFTEYAELYKNFQFTSIGAASDESIWAGGFNTDKYTDGMWHYGNMKLAANFSVNKTISYLNDSTVIFTDNSYGSPETWVWNFGDGANPQTMEGKGPHTVKYTTTGVKNVSLTITKGADEHVLTRNNTISISTSVGITEIGNPIAVSVYPNPAKENISISNIKNAQILIYNTAGIMVYKKENINSDIPVNISELMNGTYYIKIIDENKSVVQLLTIAR